MNEVNTNKVKVVNIKNKFKWADYPKDNYEVVNIMRPNILSNPARLYQEKNRAFVINEFRKILWKDIQQGGPMVGELNRLRAIEKEGRQVILLCCCSPRPCHGDVIIKAIQWLSERSQVGNE